MSVQPPKNDKATVKPRKRRKDALIDGDDEAMPERESNDELGAEEPRSIKKAKNKGGVADTA